MNVRRMLDTWEWFREDVCELLICGYVVDIECSAFVMISYKMISDVNVFRSLIIGFVFDDGLRRLVVRKERRMFDLKGD